MNLFENCSEYKYDFILCKCGESNIYQYGKKLEEYFNAHRSQIKNIWVNNSGSYPHIAVKLHEINSEANSELDILILPDSEVKDEHNNFYSQIYDLSNIINKHDAESYNAIELLCLIINYITADRLNKEIKRNTLWNSKVEFGKN